MSQTTSRGRRLGRGRAGAVLVARRWRSRALLARNRRVLDAPFVDTHGDVSWLRCRLSFVAKIAATVLSRLGAGSAEHLLPPRSVIEMSGAFEPRDPAAAASLVRTRRLRSLVWAPWPDRRAKRAHFDHPGSSSLPGDTSKPSR